MVAGVKYLGSSLEININKQYSEIRCLYLNEMTLLQIQYSNGTISPIIKGFKCKYKMKWHGGFL